MNCHDARELFSALIDETLTREERADVYGHLATCADCRRELAAVERTVALIRGAPPAHAPAGFVDRVVAAAHPAPWYARAARASLRAWLGRLPLGAAAILLVAGLAVLMLRGTKEQQRAARYEPTPPPVLADRRVTAERPVRDGARAPSPEAKRTEPTAPAAPPGEREKAAAAMSTPTMPPEVVARLATPQRDTAEHALAALAARLAGAQTGRRVVGDALVVELAIPRARYADFTREAARLGDYRTESEPPTLPDTVRIAVRLGP